MEDNKNTRDSNVEEALPAYNKRYTYSDYLQWDDDEERRELIDGVPYVMAGPNRKHQKILGKLHLQFGNFLEGKPCEVYLSPFDVRLNADTLDDTVVQPDLIIVCDEFILDDASCKGVPDMVIEILSPSTASYDRNIKFKKYLQVGIKEYWIIDPVAQSLAIHILQDGSYITHAYTCEETVPVHVLKDCRIDLTKVFAE